MIVLLDAHALLWWLAADAGLRDDAKQTIEAPATDVLVSAATIWEIEIKRVLGRLRTPPGIVAAVEAAQFDVLPITGTDAERAAALPPHHRDPFDRMLIAQADRVGALIVTRDAAFAAYDVETLPA